MISRDWHCLNERCGVEFHSFEKSNPPCPKCGCVRVSWIPGGGHIMGMAPRIDKRLQLIAETQGLKNLNSPSPSRLNRAAPRVNTPPMSPELGQKHWGLGISSEMSRHGPVCVESSSGVNLVGKLPVGQFASPRGPNPAFPGPGANAIIEGRTIQRSIK
jgi:hypothetical protein